MNRNQVTILLVLVLLFGGLGLVVYKRNSASWEPGASSAGGKVLGEFALNDVTRITLKDSSSSLTLAKKNDAWTVQERGDYPADFAKIGNFIQRLWELKSVQELKVGPSQLGRLHLVTPGADGKAEEIGTLVELQGAASKPVGTLLLGKKFLKKSGPEDGEGFPAGRYVLPLVPPGNGTVALVSESLDEASPKAPEWLNKEFIHPERIAAVSLTGTDAGHHWKLSRAKEDALEWTLAGVKPDEKVDSHKIPTFAAILGSPGFNDVREPGAKTDGFDTVVTVETFDHFIYTLKFGKEDGTNLPLAFTVTADLPKERTPGKEEKPEEKKKLDDEFAATTKRLTEKLAKEKALEGRVYLVSKTSFEPLFKARAELLEEKKAAASPSPAPAVTGGLPEMPHSAHAPAPASPASQAVKK